MTKPRLGQLFDCIEQGAAFVAEAADGTLVHIEDVPFGLACACNCPGCGRRMVARKGAVKVHHFAHHSERDGSTCTSPGETALHKFAKSILDERLEIALPEMVVENSDDREVVVQPTKITFEAAVLEARAESVVPDVVLELRDRKLIVEFKVTHACDETKIARIRSMNVGAIEIDLSAYRERPLEELAEEILYNAPRIWLHNPRETDARARLAERARKRAEARKEEIRKYSAKYRHRRPASDEGGGACESSVRRDGLGALINLDIDGAGCFTVPAAEWQAATILELLAHDQSPFRTRNGLSALMRRKWIGREFKAIPDDIAIGLKESGLPFASPLGAVEAYLKHLERLGLLRSAPSEIWRPTHSMLLIVEQATDLRARPARRLAEIREMVTQQLDGLPEEETSSFVFQAWVETVLPGRDLSIADALQNDDADWTSLCNDLANVRTNIRFSPRADIDLLGLPCAGELARAIERKHRDADERVRRKREAEQAAAKSRINQLCARAPREIGDHARIWIAMPLAALDGLSPLDAAATAEGFTAATRALDQRVRELDREERARRHREKAVGDLEALARSRYYNPDHATLWMRSSRRELGGKSPAEFTIDDATRDQCAALLPTKRSHR
ncbi:hypothetical protein [Mesorhizobium sp. 2RAF21]|uniref:hypothetical protein n=1 Tax=Mesorhizobium sp. 2RAF21 TaxID=3232995 RepID=UPI003F9BF533